MDHLLHADKLESFIPLVRKLDVKNYTTFEVSDVILHDLWFSHDIYSVIYNFT